LQLGEFEWVALGWSFTLPGGYVDLGWRGHLTWELSNVTKLSVSLNSGMKIRQISFLRLTTRVDGPYGSDGVGSKYRGQSELTAGPSYADFQQR
jgi:dCTP deaminase